MLYRTRGQYRARAGLERPPGQYNEVYFCITFMALSSPSFSSYSFFSSSANGQCTLGGSWDDPRRSRAFSRAVLNSIYIRFYLQNMEIKSNLFKFPQVLWRDFRNIFSVFCKTLSPIEVPLLFYIYIYHSSSLQVLTILAIVLFSKDAESIITPRFRPLFTRLILQRIFGLPLQLQG